MEKISGIVRGNARVVSTDTKQSSAVRPGAPALGRPMGESTQGGPAKSSTASRAVALHNDMTEAKKAVSEERVIAKMANEFFMSKMRGTEPDVESGIQTELTPQTEVQVEQVLAGEAAQTVSAPKEYTPRGSFVDVHA